MARFGNSLCQYVYFMNLMAFGGFGEMGVWFCGYLWRGGGVVYIICWVSAGHACACVEDTCDCSNIMGL